ncbi:PAS domain-containing protein [Bdellovibrio sp.]|uniref:PAS domain-containing protein n=1 Tax=Bdellovibrio sp. TaxID=28201 RepID=UPI002F35642F
MINVLVARPSLNLPEKKKTIEYFSFWKLQNKITLAALIAILLLSTVFAICSILLPPISSTLSVIFIVMIPTLACFGIATCHSSNLESRKALREYQRLLLRLSEAENSQITLDRFFSLSSDLMAVAGKDGLLKKASKSLVNTLGYSEETLLNTPFFEFIHPDDREATSKNIESLNLGVRSVGFENRYRAADGTYRTLSWSAAADTELGVRFASARNITDERNFQIRTQQIMDSAPFLILVKDINGKITSCNAAFCKAIGMSRTSLLEKDLQDFAAFDFISSSFAKEQEAIKSQRPITFEEVLTSQGGSTRYLSTIFPIIDQTGKIVSVGKISLDINQNTKSI